MRIALDHHAVGDVHSAGLGDTADVVAAEIEQHDVLGDFLGIRRQLARERFVFVAGGAAWTGAGDRPQRDRPAFLAYQDLGRRAHHVEIPKS